MLEVAIDNHVNFMFVGVGSGACRIVNSMAENKTEYASFVCIDTDERCLSECRNATAVCIGKTITRCFGSGKGPGIGRAAAEENWEEIKTLLSQADAVFIITCLGGGTGTGAAPVVAALGKEAGKFTIGVAIKPFSFESGTCLNNAETGVRKLRKNSDSIMVINNDCIFKQKENFSGISDVFSGLVSELWKCFKSVTDLINVEGLINIDFADMQAVFKDKEVVYTGVGTSTDESEERCINAARQAVNNPLMEMELKTADCVLLGISGRDIGLQESSEAACFIEDIIGEDSAVIFGITDLDVDVTSVAVIASRSKKEE